jgi:hypothetical protein
MKFITEISRARHWYPSQRPSHLVLSGFAKLRKAASCLYVCLSVCMVQVDSHWTDFQEIWCLNILWKSLQNIQVWLKSTTIKGNLYEDVRIFMVISGWILLRMRNISDKNCTEKSKYTFYFQQHFSLKSSVYETIQTNVVQSHRPQMPI